MISKEHTSTENVVAGPTLSNGRLN